MASRFQAASLPASPLYPNAIAWSDENLIAVACGALVTILNPALPSGPRGFLTIPASESYPIGLVKREDLLAECLLPTALSKDFRQFVRSISWSPIGMAPNSGCLLAVCTTEGHVKLYQPPIGDFSAEWIEVADVSDRLYDYLSNTNFGEFVDGQTTESGCIDDHANVFPKSISRKEPKRRRADAGNGITMDSETFGGNSIGLRNGEKPHVRSSPLTDMRGEQLSKITADQYASRRDMLSSLVIAWSPMLFLPSKIYSLAENGSFQRFSILAVGSKSGKISIWRIFAPKQYSIAPSSVSTGVTLVGLLQAHNSWVTAVSLACSSNSNPQVMLASGSSDGSVKIWLAKHEELLESSESNIAPFFLVKEVISANAAPISILSISIPIHEMHKMHLAVGKGSGSLEVWTSDISSSKFDKAGSYDAHDRFVTGLAWAFGGRCLYSCSQDNYVRCWKLCDSSLYEVTFTSSTLGLRSSNDLSDVFVSCLGVAVSPGDLALATVRNLDADELDHMYEGRVQKAGVEFFWIGAQQLDMLPDISIHFDNKSLLDFPTNELVHWESNILWSLKKFSNPDKPLFIWDIVASLMAFKQSVPEFVDHILANWLSITYYGSLMNLSINEVLTQISDDLSKITSRQLHILNVTCRRIVLSEFKADEILNKSSIKEPTNALGEQKRLWIELLLRSEKELQKRLVAFSLSAFVARIVSQPGCWHPIGVPQMEHWIELNSDHVRDQLESLLSEVQHKKRWLSSDEYSAEEQCSYCSAPVPFNSPEYACCQGSKAKHREVQKHKLVRCAVSMRVCPSTPLWFCKCCNRRVSTLAPQSFFTITSGYPLDFRRLLESSDAVQLLEPLCPFCGILLQRLQPDFLLSVSPV